MKETKQLSSHQFPEVYKSLGIDINKLGCIMLDVEFPQLSLFSKYKNIFYKAKEKERFWINGLVCLENAHITLLYGLLESGEKLKPYADKVLNDWDLKEIEIQDINYFNSPFQDEEYYCIVADIKLTSELMEGHQRLEFLPHINTFAGYKAHVTIAYIKKDKSILDMFINDLRKDLIRAKLKVQTLNYGIRKK